MPHPDHDPDALAALETAQDLAAGIARTLRMAAALAMARRPVDLAGLDGPIGLLCAKSLDLPPATGRQMRATLFELLQEVDAMSAVLRGRADRGSAPD